MGKAFDLVVECCFDSFHLVMYENQGLEMDSCNLVDLGGLVLVMSLQDLATLLCWILMESEEEGV